MTLGISSVNFDRPEFSYREYRVSQYIDEHEHDTTTCKISRHIFSMVDESIENDKTRASTAHQKTQNAY